MAEMRTVACFGDIRRLIDKIILTPNEDRSALILDLIGDLAGILQVADKSGSGKLFNPNATLSDTQEAEIERAKEFAKTSGFLGKESVVAGAKFNRCRTRFRLSDYTHQTFLI